MPERVFNRAVVPAVAVAALVMCFPTDDAAPPAFPYPEAKARIVVMTDIGGDPDDRQSLVRFPVVYVRLRRGGPGVPVLGTGTTRSRIRS